MIRIENKRHWNGEGVFVGRPTLLGNPFVIGEHGTRKDVIEHYRRWLWEQILLMGDVYREVKRLADMAKKGDLVLICWCKEPGRDIPCHADILKSAVTWINATESHSVIAPTINEAES